MNLYPHQKELVQRTRESYKRGCKFPCIVSPCGSGKSVIIAEIARLTALNKRRVLFIVHRRELIEQVRETIRGAGADMDYIDLISVQSLVRRLGKIREPSLIITDESHHGMAGSYLKVYEYYKDVLKLGFTATPIRLDGRGLGKINDALIEGKTVKWLIENSYLAPYKMFAPTLAVSLKNGQKREYTAAQIDKAMQHVIYGDVVEHYKKLADGKQAIVYSHRISKSKEVASAFNEAGIKSAHIDGKTSQVERSRLIEGFRTGKIKVLCNVDLIGEGFDVPDCEVVILLRPTVSLALYIQQAMRSMRYKTGKTAIIIDHVGNCLRHGLPDDTREWTLEDREKRASPKAKSESVRQCSRCYGAFSPRLDACPHCGAAYVSEEVVLEERKGAKLKEVSKIVTFYKEPKDCKSMSDLYLLAKSRGYKRGWAYYQGKKMGLLGG